MHQLRRCLSAVAPATCVSHYAETTFFRGEEKRSPRLPPAAPRAAPPVPVPSPPQATCGQGGRARACLAALTFIGSFPPVQVIGWGRPPRLCSTPCRAGTPFATRRGLRPQQATRVLQPVSACQPPSWPAGQPAACALLRRRPGGLVASSRCPDRQLRAARPRGRTRDPSAAGPRKTSPAARGPRPAAAAPRGDSGARAAP